MMRLERERGGGRETLIFARSSSVEIVTNSQNDRSQDFSQVALMDGARRKGGWRFFTPQPGASFDRWALEVSSPLVSKLVADC
jgi:hypothetical protein